MTISRVLAIVALIFFLGTSGVVLARKYSDSGLYTWADVAARMYYFDAWAWASAAPWDQGFYSIWAEVDDDRDYEGGSYHGPLSTSVSASGSRGVGQPDPFTFYHDFIN